MAEPFVGQIALFPYVFVPANWHACDGSLLPIAQWNALFSLLGTQFGGNGTTTFGLPDLRGRIVVGTGNGPGLSPYTQGQIGGTENTTLNVGNLAPHSHAASFQVTAVGTRPPTPVNAAAGNYLTGLADTQPPPISSTVTLASDTVTVQAAGSSTPFSNLQPYLALQFCIALIGVYPSRS